MKSKLLCKAVTLLTGFVFVWQQQSSVSLSWQLQTILFIAGVVVFGIPHGAADMLVASRNCDLGNKSFSKLRFLRVYLLRLLFFAVLLWWNPLIGLILFMILAAFHFGETDLSLLKLNTWSGKLTALLYGFSVLGFILVRNAAEIIPLLHAYDPSFNAAFSLSWLNRYSGAIVITLTVLLFAAGVLYYLLIGISKKELLFLFVQSACLFAILYNLPLLTGFIFYFIIWHSSVSLENIFRYLCKDTALPAPVVLKQIMLYSVLALAGIAVAGLLGVMFSTAESLVIYLIAGLAVLTAPHMEVMHEMYVYLSK